MPRFASRTALAFACALAWVAAVSASDAVPSAAVGVPEQPEPPRLVVLRNGDVVEGSIRFAQGGYEVEAKGGRVFLADSFVWFAAQHRRDAYEQLGRRAPCRTADDHVDRARWCLKNRLHSCAEQELRIALEQEPDHAGARATLRSLHDLLRTGSTGAARAEPAWGGETETLGGLRPALAREFVATIQPLLVNRCANAACHGPTAKNGFVLKVVRSGNPAFARLTEENLEAVRGQLSASHPETSPLLVEAGRVGHGKTRGKTLFPGPAGEAQLKALGLWVAQVARSAPKADAAVRNEPSPLVLTAATAETPADAVAPAVAEPGEEPTKEPTERDATSDLLRKALTDRRPDAFDPDEFNRRYGPPAGRMPPSQRQGPTR